MAPPLITALYASLGALFFLWLTAQVIRGRRGTGTSLGDGGHASLEKAIRGHGNAAEQMPIFFILLGLAEMTGFPAWALHLFGIAFLLGRVLHGLRFNGIGPGQFRVIGMATGLTTLAALAISLLVSTLMGGA